MRYYLARALYWIARQCLRLARWIGPQGVLVQNGDSFLDESGIVVMRIAGTMNAAQRELLGRRVRISER